MNKHCFIDTGAYLSLFYVKDNYHSSSLKIWNKILDSNIQTVITNHIIDETATLLSRRTNNLFAATKVDKIYQSNTRIYRPNQQEEEKALILFKKYADQRISFTDCLSFVVMKKLKVKQVFSFDKHFRFAGFDLLSDN